MKSNCPTLPLAILAAATSKQVGFATLALDASLNNDGWCQLLPAGFFSAVDGRPLDVDGGKWFIDAAIAQRLIDTAQALKNDLVLDYEHQTLNADQNGKPAPAAGWIKDMQWRDGSDSQSADAAGLWIKVEWTATARDYIKNGEYRYLSAVFPYDKTTGTPLMIHSAALVNRPGLDGLQVASLSAAVTHTSNYSPHQNSNQETFVMNETLRKLLAKLGIQVVDGEELTEAQSTAALSALNLLSTKAASVEGLNTEVAALKISTSVDLSAYVPAATYNALVTQTAVLKADSAKNTAKQLIDEAQQCGKVMAAELDYLTAFADQQGIVKLKALLDSRPMVAALKGQQTSETKVPKDTDDLAVLSAAEQNICAATGVSEADYIKTKTGK